MKDKNFKSKKMSMGKYYRKRGWSISQLTKQQREAKGYRIEQTFENKLTKIFWITTAEFKKNFK